MKINSFNKQKHAYLILTWSDKAFVNLCIDSHLKLNITKKANLKIN